MLLVDVNVLVYAYRPASDRHAEYRDWLDQLVNGDQPFGMADEVLCAFLRLITNPRVFQPAERVDLALGFVRNIRSSSACVRVTPGVRHWTLFSDLCDRLQLRGNLIPDAWFAALAMESGCRWITTDRGFARYPGLDWRHPLA